MIREVTNNIYRGDRPKDLLQIRDLGKKVAIINLENDRDAVFYEGEAAYHLGMLFENHPLSEFERPPSKKLRKIVARIQELVALGYTVFIHCKHGKDRTGYVVAALRMLTQGWSFERAYKEAKDMGHKWWFAPYLLLWPKSLKELAV